MKWVLDVGNTAAKLAGFRDQAAPWAPPVTVHRADVRAPELVARAWVKEVGSDPFLLTGSGEVSMWVDAWEAGRDANGARGGAPVVWPQGTSLPLPTHVKAPNRLGLDRVANAWGVLHGAVEGAAPQGSWLVVDVGTCVTFDLVHDQAHWGGAISPGMALRAKSMHAGTANLPPISLGDAEGEAGNGAFGVGADTDHAMRVGAVGGVGAEIHGRWLAMRQELPNLGVILTGGDAFRLELRHISPKFADAHLTLKGYHALFTHHLKPS
jgi:pantothenate kinase type III